MSNYQLPQFIKLNENFSMELIHKKHAKDLFDITCRDKDDLETWLPWVRQTKDVSYTEAYINNFCKQQMEAREAWHYAILLNGKACGVISYHPINWSNRSVSLGYWLGTKERGHGIVAKAAAELIEIAFNYLFLNKISIECGSENLPSQKIARTLGFKLEGLSRSAEWLYERFIDHCLFGLLKSDWQNPYRSI